MYIEGEGKQAGLENAEAQMRKGVLELAIMLVIDKRATYVGEILERLLRARLTVVEGTVYPLLSRLKNAGLLGYDWRESRSGPPRKYYFLTSKGRQFLAAYDSQWRLLVKAIDNLRK